MFDRYLLSQWIFHFLQIDWTKCYLVADFAGIVPLLRGWLVRRLHVSCLLEQIGNPQGIYCDV